MGHWAARGLVVSAQPINAKLPVNPGDASTRAVEGASITSCSKVSEHALRGCTRSEEKLLLTDSALPWRI